MLVVVDVRNRYGYVLSMHKLNNVMRYQVLCSPNGSKFFESHELSINSLLLYSYMEYSLLPKEKGSSYEVSHFPFHAKSTRRAIILNQIHCDGSVHCQADSKNSLRAWSQKMYWLGWNFSNCTKELCTFSHVSRPNFTWQWYFSKRLRNCSVPKSGPKSRPSNNISISIFSLVSKVIKQVDTFTNYVQYVFRQWSFTANLLSFGSHLSALSNKLFLYSVSIQLCCLLSEHELIL